MAGNRQQKHDNERKINEITDDCGSFADQFDTHPFVEVLFAYTLLKRDFRQSLIGPINLVHGNTVDPFAAEQGDVYHIKYKEHHCGDTQHYNNVIYNEAG